MVRLWFTMGILTGLSICRAAYLEGLDLPDCAWLNTKKASREAWAHLPNHKLDTLCEDLTKH